MKQMFKITKDTGIPLVGLIQIGLIDRGTNLIQVRPTTRCNLQCIFCSTDSGPNSKYHITEYEVENNYLLEEFNKIAEFKGVKIEANIDSVGEPLMYKDIFKLIKGLKKNKNVNYISMQTNGTLLTKDTINKLKSVGLDRINLSIQTLNPELAKRLSGVKSYNLGKIKEVAKLIKDSKIELLIAPVWIPNINDKDTKDLIEFAKSLNAKIGIQKYEIHKYGRKAKKAKPQNYWRFYKKLGELEKEYSTKLKIGPRDFNIIHAKRLKKPFRKGEKVFCKVKMPGWTKNQMIGVAKNRCLTIVNCNKKINTILKVRVLGDNNNIFITSQV